jgi:hypothetical protein
MTNTNRWHDLFLLSDVKKYTSERNHKTNKSEKSNSAFILGNPSCSIQQMGKYHNARPII